MYQTRLHGFYRQGSESANDDGRCNLRQNSRLNDFFSMLCQIIIQQQPPKSLATQGDLVSLTTRFYQPVSPQQVHSALRLDWPWRYVHFSSFPGTKRVMRLTNQETTGIDGTIFDRARMMQSLPVLFSDAQKSSEVASNPCSCRYFLPAATVCMSARRTRSTDRPTHLSRPEI